MKRLFLVGLWTILCFIQTAEGFDNVLIVSIDTLRADYLSSYGSQKVKTPNLDALAARGVAFKNTVSPAPFTLPSHVSILTGLIPPAHGVHDNGGFYLDTKITTLAEIFKARGNSTAAFIGAFPLDSRFGLDQGFDLYDDSYPTGSNVSEITMPERNAKDVADRALDWMKSNQNKKWFAFVHFYDPHFPYNPPEPYKSTYKDDPYAGEVAFADEQVGRLLNFLKETKQDHKTLVVVTSDHGESLGDHKEETHGFFAYESTLRVPLIMAPFKQSETNVRVRSIDIFPTVLSVFKISHADKTQGMSLMPYLEGQKEGSPRDSYFEALSLHLNAGWAPLRGFYSKNFKYISLPVPELYDLSKDPKETQNLCSNSSLCNTWARNFQIYYKPYSNQEVRAAEIDKETMEQLQALGYISGGATRVQNDGKYGPEDDPKNLIGFHNRIDAALSFYNKGYELKALEILEKIIEEKPDYSVAYLHAGFIRSQSGLPDKAVEIMKQAIQNGIINPEIQGKLGVYLFEAGKHDEAIKNLLLAIKEDPNNLDNLNYLGMSYTAASKFKEAEAAFRKALAIDPTDGMTLTNMGMLYLTQKKYTDAIKQFRAAIDSNPVIANAYNGLGVVYAAEKNWQGAVESWKKATDLNQKNYDAMLNLGYAYLELKDRENALQTFRKFEKNAPPNRYGKDLAQVRSIIRQLQ